MLKIYFIRSKVLVAKVSSFVKKSSHLFLIVETIMLIDRAGYRLNVGIILMNDANRVFWGKRYGHDAWQFPQGGLAPGETPKEALFRELKEEIGLERDDVEVLGVTKRWLKYRLPKQYLRHGSEPLVIGQKQKWFLLKLRSNEQKVRLDLSNSPEFDSWRWVDYKEPQDLVIFFKKQVYIQALKELEYLLKKRHPSLGLRRRRAHHGGHKS